VKISLFSITEEYIETAVKYFNDTIQWAGWNATPEHTDLPITTDYPILIKQKQQKKGNSEKTGADSEHQKAEGYSTQQHKIFFVSFSRM
jgi:hypothetical protein